MSSPSLSDQRQSGTPTEPFRSIACGVDGTRAGFEAARQAATLARDGASLQLLAVPWETGTRAAAMVALSRRRAKSALDRARAIARELDVQAEGLLVDGPTAAEKLLEAASAHDLLVLGSSGRSHAGGLMLGHTGDELLREASMSVLVARRPPAGVFPASILLAVADRAAVLQAATAAGELARRHGGDVTVLACQDSGSSAHRAVAEAVTVITELTAVEPVVIDAQGKFHTAADHVAAERGASLIVTAGKHAERVAECARCSVLLLRR